MVNVNIVEGDNVFHRLKISAGQKPAVAVIGCADSRCDPKELVDCNEGELFVTRVAGNYVDACVAGSVRFLHSPTWLSL